MFRAPGLCCPCISCHQPFLSPFQTNRAGSEPSNPTPVMPKPNTQLCLLSLRTHRRGRQPAAVPRVAAPPLGHTRARWRSCAQSCSSPHGPPGVQTGPPGAAAPGQYRLQSPRAQRLRSVSGAARRPRVRSRPRAPETEQQLGLSPHLLAGRHQPHLSSQVVVGKIAILMQAARCVDLHLLTLCLTSACSALQALCASKVMQPCARSAHLSFCSCFIAVVRREMSWLWCSRSRHSCTCDTASQHPKLGGWVRAGK